MRHWTLAMHIHTRLIYTKIIDIVNGLFTLSCPLGLRNVMETCWQSDCLNLKSSAVRFTILRSFVCFHHSYKCFFGRSCLHYLVVIVIAVGFWQGFHLCAIDIFCSRKLATHTQTFTCQLHNQRSWWNYGLGLDNFLQCNCCTLFSQQLL